MNSKESESATIHDEIYHFVNYDFLDIEQKVRENQSLTRASISTINDRVWGYTVGIYKDDEDAEECAKEALDDVLNFLLIQESLLDTLEKLMNEADSKIIDIANKYSSNARNEGKTNACT